MLVVRGMRDMLAIPDREKLATRLSLRPITAAILVALFGAAYAAADTGLMGDGDTSWHIATGRWILEHRTVPDGDPFSFSMPGVAWHAHEWLSEIPMALAFNAGGWSALSVMFVLAFAATLLMVGRELGRHLPSRWVLALTMAVAGTLFASTLARPHLLAWPLLTGWLLLLLHAREARRAPPLAAALLMVVWANLHASYIVGLGLVGVFALEALVEDRKLVKAIRDWAPFGLLTLACAFVTPHGVQGFLYPFQVSGMESLAVIQEWRPTSIRKDTIFVAYLTSVVCMALISWRRVGLVRLILLAGLGWMALEHVRHHSVFALVAVLAVLPRAAVRYTGRAQPEATPPIDRRAAALLGGGLLVIALTRLIVPLVPDKGPARVEKALDAVPAALLTQPVLNSYSFGGPLILRGVPVFIDGRADMYGDRFTLEYNKIANGDIERFRAAAKRYDLRWTVLWHEDELAPKLDKEPGWKRIYQDKSAVVHVRTAQP